MLDDLRGRRMGVIDYILFAKSMADLEPIYKSIYIKLYKENKNKIQFAIEQDEILKYEDEDYQDFFKLEKVKTFFDTYKDKFPNWFEENKQLYNDIIKQLNTNNN